MHAMAEVSELLGYVLTFKAPRKSPGSSQTESFINFFSDIRNLSFWCSKSYHNGAITQSLYKLPYLFLVIFDPSSLSFFKHYVFPKFQNTTKIYDWLSQKGQNCTILSLKIYRSPQTIIHPFSMMALKYFQTRLGPILYLSGTFKGPIFH